MISVIVPHHEETVEQMRPLLCSLDLQQSIDFSDMELIIVNDSAESALKQDDLSAYKNIQSRTRTFMNDKRGYMGVSRQVGIDHADGDYVIFCDADDMLYTPTLLFDLLSRKEADIYSFNFIEQRGKFGFVVHEKEFTWVFDKCYRTEFLRKNNIRFSDTLMWHEDTYFNQLCLAYRPQIVYLGYVGYFWKYNEKSVTRTNDNEYTQKSLPIFIDALDERLMRIDRLLNADAKILYHVEDITYIYCCLQEIVQKDLVEKCREDTERRLVQYIQKYDPNLKFMEHRYAGIVSERIRKIFARMVLLPQEGFYEFIERILNKYGGKYA